MGAAAVPTIIGGFLTLPGTHFLLVQIVGFALISYVVTLVFVALFTFPLYFWLARRGLIRSWVCVSAGFLVGTAVIFFLRLPQVPRGTDILLFASEGCVAGGVFWVIWRSGGKHRLRDTLGEH
jgi:hypothetical protein